MKNKVKYVAFLLINFLNQKFMNFHLKLFLNGIIKDGT